ncbi:MAG: VWA domain-containing protein [Rubripirellula sp.]|nr:VWA domain-containing protein [Rubripirellula sp.]
MKQPIKPQLNLINHARRGAMLVQIAIMMIGFMLAITFSIDSAQMQLTQTEMNTATEAAAKAIAGTLADTQDLELAIIRGQELAASNQVNGNPLNLETSDIQFGRTAELGSGRLKFEPAKTPYNSVSVQGKHNFEPPVGSSPLIFSRIFGAVVLAPKSSATATYVERDIVLVVDRSEAMSDEDLRAVKQAIESFSSVLSTTAPHERVGLVSYSQQASADVDLTDQFPEISNAINCLEIGGSANVTQGMLAAERILKQSHQRSWIQPIMIVIANGVSKTRTDPKALAASLGADGIQVMTVTCGANTDQNEMQRIAELGNGRHFHAEHGADLEPVFQRLANSLSTMMTQPMGKTSPGNLKNQTSKRHH